MTAPLVSCRRCSGNGRHAMPTAYARTLSMVTNDWQTTTELLAKLPNVGTTALCNRLAWLKREGFVESRQTEHNGRLNEWRLAAEATSA